jgi:hypothetical protein
MSDDRLVEFAKAVIRASWEGCEFGDVIQEEAVKFGLIECVPFDPAKHTDDTGYAGVGDPWFVFTAALST